MSWTLTASIPAGVVAGTLPTAVFSTTAGLEGFACATVAAGATTVACSGATVGNALQSSLVTVVLGPGMIVTGIISGVGPRGVPPAPPIVLPPPPPPPLVPVGLPLVAGPPTPSEVPVIPETESLALLGAGLLAVLAAVGLRHRRR
jgi:hypothetical protein